MRKGSLENEFSLCLVATSGRLDLSIQPSVSGVKVDTDNEAIVEIKTSNYGVEKELVTESKKGADYYVTKKGSNIEVKADTTNDGTYETLVSVTDAPQKVSTIKVKNKNVTFNGKNRTINAAKISNDVAPLSA